MSLSEMQDELDKMWDKRKRSKKCQFVIGHKNEIGDYNSFGIRPHRSKGMGSKFTPMGRAKNKNPRYMAQLVLGDNT